MSVENIKKFYEKLSSDTELQNRLVMTKPGQEEEDLLIRMLLPIAEEAGFPFSESDFRQYLKESASQELDGAIRDWGACACIFGGGGRNEVDDCTCACVLGGGGKSDRDGYYLYCVVAGSVDLL